MKPFYLCKPYLLYHKHALIAYITIILAGAAIAILSPYIIGDFLDTLISGADMGVIFSFCIIFGGMSLLKTIKGYVAGIMYTKMQVNMSYKFNRAVIKHIHGLSLSYLNQEDSGYLSQRVGVDTASLVGYCISVLRNIISNVIVLVAPFVILLRMNWFIAVLMLGFIGIYTALYFVFKKLLYRAGLAFREAQARFYSRLLEQFKHIKLIKLNSLQSESIKRADDSYSVYEDATINNQRVSYLYHSMDETVSTIAQVVLFVIGGIQVMAGNFTIGMFTIFTSYFKMMLGASRYFFGLGALYQNTLVAYDRIRKLLSYQEENQGDTIISDINQIDLRNVRFSYWADPVNGCATKSVINGLNVSFSKGNIYAVVGANGTGKSTLVSLMLGMYIDEYKGSIVYDGIDIRNIDMIVARKRLIGFAEQEPQLMNDTVRYNIDFDNIDLVNEKYLDEDFYKSISYHANFLGLQDFLTDKGLGYTINEKNTNTSGGEKQKISILKVLYKNPIVMVFDEPNSALDARSTEMFFSHLNKIKRDKIVIIITHDETVKKCCDLVIEMDKCGQLQV